MTCGRIWTCQSNSYLDHHVDWTRHRESNPISAPRTNHHVNTHSTDDWLDSNQRPLDTEPMIGRTPVLYPTEPQSSCEYALLTGVNRTPQQHQYSNRQIDTLQALTQNQTPGALTSHQTLLRTNRYVSCKFLLGTLFYFLPLVDVDTLPHKISLCGQTSSTLATFPMQRSNSIDLATWLLLSTDLTVNCLPLSRVTMYVFNSSSYNQF